ncbi:Metal-dependent hydrolase, endonuclease/exonuclease/phosphatase family [Stigmatella aurantiaca]|uniref:Metal-dependent hydrolase, endonuclease/exonuclease/phosphatase family n=1 Tax=Stigmatella aurantiaca TaxID=41 RepID=A0A1H7GIC6_STIAU|nr:lamin tail domain-containing protein [Stigmatella aurantiaca]SEK37317.1 Metal-dependent hydrolase, endonuclease/exonuclease/phosphatase family [Stigmatella aurantiaca]
MRISKTASRDVLAAALLLLTLVSCGAQPEGEAEETLASQESALASVRVRLMAANITSGNLQSYDPGHGTRLFQGTDPDIVMIQEFNYGDNSAASIRQFVNTAFGSNFYYYREGGAQIPNGVISRYPIIASGEWDDPQVDNRDFAYARIDIPGPKDLWVVSVHLLTASSTTRNTEASSLVSRIKASIPAGDYLAIGGDFNTDSRSESCFSTFSQVVVTSSPYPADKNGNTNTNASRGKPYDHVLVNSGLRAYQTATVIGGSTFANGLVLDSRVYSPLSEISPVQSADSGATNMQHMAVIKDFLIPSDTTSAGLSVGAPNGGESWAAGSSQSITWTASGVTNVKVEYSLNGGSTWTVLSSSTAASTGRYTWTVPSSATTTARVRVSDAANAALSDTSDAAFFITEGGGGGTGTVFVNEVLANEAGSDVNGEFVELVNPGSTAVSLAGWTLSDAASVRHTFPSGTTLAAGAALVVFGGASGIPSGIPAVAASTGTLGLSNSGDTVTVKNSAGTVVDTATLSSALCGTDGVSANRSPDGSSSGAFVLHTGLAGTGSSPGKRASGADF